MLGFVLGEKLETRLGTLDGFPLGRTLGKKMDLVLGIVPDKTLVGSKLGTIEWLSLDSITGIECGPVPWGKVGEVVLIPRLAEALERKSFIFEYLMSIAPTSFIYLSLSNKMSTFARCDDLGSSMVTLELKLG